MNLHDLDHKLQAIKEIDSKYDPEKTEKIIKAFSTLSLSPNSFNVLGILINDLGKPNNYDPINRLSVDDLLLEIANRIELGKIDVLTLDQQLTEMLTGMCPQGRSIRLYSVIFASMTH